MSGIVFPGSSAQGAALQESAGQLIDGYAVKTNEARRSTRCYGGAAPGVAAVVQDGRQGTYASGAILVGCRPIVVLDQPLPLR